MTRKTSSLSVQIVVSVIAFAGAGAASWYGALKITDRVEADLRARARSVFAAQDLDWVQPRSDGLLLRLSGTADDDVSRFHALNAARAVVPQTRIVDQIKVDQRDMLEPPEFVLRLMRQGGQVSMIGLVPARTDRDGLDKRLSQSGAEVTDLTSTASFPAPAGWTSAVDFAAAAAVLLDQGTLSVTPGVVSVQANVASQADRQRIEAALQEARPETVRLDLALNAPLPVIAPFTLNAARGDDGAIAISQCSAGSPVQRDAIFASAGLAPDTPCAIGLGAPDDWDRAASVALEAVARLGGTLDLTDNRLSLIVPFDSAPDLVKTETERLVSGLPPSYSASVTLAERTALPGPPHFTAVLNGKSPAVIAGGLPDVTMRETVSSIARAQLGPVDADLTIDQNLPEGWALRVMAGLDAMGAMDEGTLDVTTGSVRIEGISGDPLAGLKAVAALADRLGAGQKYGLRIAYDRRRDPNVAAPDAASCVDRLNGVMVQSEIGFEPSGSRIAGDIEPVLEAMRPILAECADFRIEIGGHTDSHGATDSNLKLSEQRAKAVLAALGAADLPTAELTARGYGETRPIAENDTAEGRDANRRIEFILRSPDPVAREIAPGDQITGLTPDAETAGRNLLSAALAGQFDTEGADPDEDMMFDDTDPPGIDGAIFDMDSLSDVEGDAP